MIFDILEVNEIEAHPYYWLVILRPSDEWKEKSLTNNGFPRWCSAMNNLLESELGPNGKDWSSRKYAFVQKLFLRFKEQSNLSLFLMKYK